MFHWLFIALALCGGLQHSPAPGWGVSAHFDSTSLHLSPGPALVKRQPQDSPSLLPQPPAVAPESAVVSNSAAVATEPPSTEVEASSAMNTLQSQTATATAIATTAETVSATATAATPTTATATPLPTTAGVTKGDIIVVSCFFVLIFVSIVGTLLYFYITDRFKEPEVVLLERMQTQREVENLVENLHAQLRTLRSMPYSWSNMKPFRVHHLISWCFVAGIIMAFGILLAGLLKGSLSGSFYNTTHANTTSTHREWSAQKSNTPPLVYPLESPSNTQDWAWTPPTSSISPSAGFNSTLVRRENSASKPTDALRSADIQADRQTSEEVMMAGTFLFFIMLNFFYMTRQHLYYERRKTLALDQTKHHILNKTVYNHYERNWQNTMQIVILIVEFIQLLSFPLQDLLKNTTIVAVEDSAIGTVDVILALTSFFPRLSSSLYVILFWTVFTTVLVFFIFSLLFHVINSSEKRRDQGRTLPIYWVSYFVPIVSLLYLPILCVFVSSAQCLSKQVFAAAADVDNFSVTQDIDRGNFFKCHSPSIQPVAYFVASIVGYTVAYLMMTTFVTSYDRTPVEGEILFKSKAIAMIKNMSLLLTIDFLLVPNDFNHLRSILSLVIMIVLVCVNIKMRPCYVDQINYWRSASFCCILWTALLVTMLNNENKTVRKMSVAGVSISIVGGMAVIVFLFWLVRRCSRDFSFETWVDIRKDQRSSIHEPLNPNSSMMAAGPPIEYQPYRFQHTV